jgi:NAD(P)-dependent dehydrogenase (short-subunit alcohol dehydrogenase family)
MCPSLNGAVVLATGANGSTGSHSVRKTLGRGADKVYASARSPRQWDDERIVPLAPNDPRLARSRSRARRVDGADRRRFSALARSGFKAGDDIAIFGAGPIDLVLASVMRSRLSRSRRLGIPSVLRDSAPFAEFH